MITCQANVEKLAGTYSLLDEPSIMNDWFSDQVVFLSATEAAEKRNLVLSFPFAFYQTHQLNISSLWLEEDSKQSNGDLQS